MAFSKSGDVGRVPLFKDSISRVDYNVTRLGDSNFDLLIETKCPRFSWARASHCPCVGFNNKTDQSDPNCTLCSGLGWYYFRPTEYAVDPSKVGKLDEVAERLIERSNGVVIKAYIAGENSEDTIYSKIGQWRVGAARATVRHRNRLGYYDRLIALDDVMVFSEGIVYDGSGILNTRYPVVEINQLRTLQTIYGEGSISLDAGRIVWEQGFAPSKGEKVSIHYLCRPVWVVMEHLKLNRTSLVRQKRPNTTTPQGDLAALPTQVMVMLEHLVMDPKGNANV